MGRSEKKATLSVKRTSGSSSQQQSVISSAPVPAAARDSRKTGLRIRSASLINTRNSDVLDKENGGDCTPTLKKVSAVVEEVAVMQHQGPVNKSAADETGAQSKKRSSKSAAPDLDYYKKLAEERKNALKETLVENEELHEELEQAKMETEVLRAEKDQLMEQNEMLAAENQQLQRLLEKAADQGFHLL